MEEYMREFSNKGYKQRIIFRTIISATLKYSVFVTVCPSVQVSLKGIFIWYIFIFFHTMLKLIYHMSNKNWIALFNEKKNFFKTACKAN